MKIKSYWLILLLIVLLSGCGLANSAYFVNNWELGTEKVISVGEEIISLESGKKNDFNKRVVSGYKKELLYSGKDGNTIKVQYREYTINRQGTFIKDGFTQTLEYDLSESNIISYQTLEVEIKEATSNKLTYVVLKDWN